MDSCSFHRFLTSTQAFSINVQAYITMLSQSLMCFHRNIEWHSVHVATQSDSHCQGTQAHISLSSEFSQRHFQISRRIAAYLQRKVNSLKVSKDVYKPLGGRVTSPDSPEKLPKPSTHDPFPWSRPFGLRDLPLCTLIVGIFKRGQGGRVSYTVKLSLLSCIAKVQDLQVQWKNGLCGCPWNI